MSPKLLLGGAMLALTALAIGHTAATLNRESTNDPKVAAAFAAMRSAVVPRTESSCPRSMADFDLGMNLNLSIALVAVVALLGILTRYTDTQPRLVGRLLLPILFLTVSVGVTSLVYFFALPAAALCAIASALLALAQSPLRRNDQRTWAAGG
jgi:hypothetical protein